MLKLRISFLFVFLSSIFFGQEIDYAKFVLDTLCSEQMHGRGYVNGGDKIASEFIAGEYKKHNLKTFTGSYFQHFLFPVNTLPDTVIFKIDGQLLKAGSQFLVSANSASINGKYKLFNATSKNKSLEKIKRKLGKKDFSDRFIIADSRLKDLLKTNLYKAKGAIVLQKDKLWWHVSNATEQSDYITILADSSSFPKRAKEIDIQINSNFIESYKSQNVIGYIEGKNQPDSFLVFTAHYDHLGRMGEKVFFPGANDNGSGVAMMLSLAKYFSQPENQPEFSIAFIAFAAEEVGLLGSYFYAENPLFPLDNICFLVNTDMVGTGDDGIKVVNGAVLNREFDLLTDLNARGNFLKAIEKRGEAANSDHYFLYKKGVKSFFIYTLGGIAEYHNIYDKAETLPLTEFSDLLKLLVDFAKELQHEK